jgi:thiamine kinase-like enzyme
MKKIKLLFYHMKRMLAAPDKFARRFIFPGLTRQFFIPFVAGADKNTVLHTNYAYGNVHILTSENFYKIAFSGSTISREFENWKKLNAYAVLRPFMPRAVKGKKFGFNFIKTDRLFPLQEKEIYNNAKTILDAFRSMGVKRQPQLHELEKINTGLQFIEKQFGKELASVYLEQLETILKTPVFMGPMHGDFHEENILMNNAGNAALIDWDCFSECGIQAFDAISLLLFNLTKNNRKSWYRLMAENHLQKWALIDYPDLTGKFIDIPEEHVSFLFFLNQLGVEISYGIDMDSKLPEISFLIDTLAGKQEN